MPDRAIVPGNTTYAGIAECPASDLNGRLKGLKCLYSIAGIVGRPGITLDEVCQEVVNLLPQAWQYPEIAGARIICGDKEFKTANFRLTERNLAADIKIQGQKKGRVEVGYPEATPETDAVPFLNEERLLIDAAAGWMGNVTEYKETEDLYRILANNSPVGTYISQDGNFQFVNPQFERYTGFTRDELVGLPASSLVYPDDREKVRGNTIAMLKRKRFVPYEFKTITKDGESHWAMETVTSVKYKGKRAVLGNFMDITERKQAEEALQKSQEKLQRMFQSANDGILVINLKGFITDLNEKTLKLFGARSKSKCVGASAFDFVAPRDGEKGLDLMQQALRQGHIETTEIKALRADGSEYDIEISGGILRDTDSSPTGFIGVVRDITERKRMEEEIKTKNQELQETHEQLVRSEKLAAIGQLASGIGHELRNPLSIIKNAVYFIRGKTARSELVQQEPRVMEFLNIIDDEISSSDKIITDLLDFSRVRKPTTAPILIERVIESSLATITIPENIELAKRLDISLPEVEIDAHQIQQVMTNIVTNGIQAMPEGGKLTISAARKGKFLEVSITDTGYGIPRKIRGKIFDPLFTTKTRGIGLGLAVCRAIVERHGGNITVKSKINQGATFLIRLPL